MFKRREKSPKAEPQLAREILEAINDITDGMASGSAAPARNEDSNNDVHEAEGFNPGDRRSRDSSVGRPPSSSYDDVDNEIDIGDDPNYLMTVNSPLGRALLALMGNQLELSKKSKISLGGYDKVCRDIVEHLQSQEQNTNLKIKSLENKMQANMIKMKEEEDKPFLDHTETIFPPTEFSSADTLKQNDHRKQNVERTFPTQHKFSGPDSKVPVAEFLRKMNDAQEECMVSKKEFRDFYKKCTTGQAWQEVTGWLDNHLSNEAIYNNFIIRYDQRTKPEVAKRELDSYEAPIDATLNIVQSEIMEKGQRAMLVYAKEARQQAFDHDCINKLNSVLPEASQNQGVLTLQKLIHKLGRMPTYTEFIAKMAIYQSVINNNYEKERPKRIEKLQRRLRKSHDSIPYKRTGRFTARVRELNTGNQKTDTTYNKNDYNQNRATNPYNKNYQSQNTRNQNGNQNNNNRPASGRQAGRNRTPNRSGGNPRSNQNNRAMNLRSHNRDPSRGSLRTNSNRPSSNRNYDNRNSNRTELAAKGRHHCSLCGMSTHSASMGCYKMRTDKGKLVFCPPSQSPCSICKREEGKTLYHPAAYCFLRPAYLHLEKNGMLSFPTREERGEMMRYINGDER
jgi:hypothetical protein